MVKKDPRTGLWYFRTRLKPKWLPPEHPGFRTKQTPPGPINSKKTAEEWERKWIAETIRDPKDRAAHAATETTVRDAAARYVQRLKANPELSDAYITSMELNLFYHVLPKFGDRLLASLTDDDLEEFKLELQAKPRRMNGLLARQKRREGTADQEQKEASERPRLAANTVRTILRTLLAVFKLAKQKNLIDRMPNFPKPPKAARKKKTFLTHEEASALLTALAAEPDEQLAVLLAIRIGLRLGEQIALHWEDIDFERNQILLKRAFKRSKSDPNKIGGLKGRDEVVVPMKADLVKALMEARQRRFGDKPARGLVFIRKGEGKAGRRMTHDQFPVILERGLRRAQIDKHVRWHDLRHTFGSHMVMAGIPIYQVQEWMGHKDPSTTQIYAHLSPEAGQKAMRKTDEPAPPEGGAPPASSSGSSSELN